MMLISIIVPVYNAERYLNKCINSIINQSYSNWELILVNDCSLDNSKQICMSFAKAYSNKIKFIDKQKNEGADIARAEGITNATGDYIMFVDADDYMPKHAISDLYNYAKKYSVDVVIGHVVKSYFNGLYTKKLFDIAEYSHRKIFKEELMEYFFISYFGVNILPCNLYGQLFKKELFQHNIKPSGITFGEDALYNMYLFQYINSIYITTKEVYYYRYGGLTTKYMPSLANDMKTAYRLKKEMIQKYAYYKAIPTIGYELKNNLHLHFKQLIDYNILRNNELKEYINNEINNPIYKDLIYLPQKDSFTNALINKQTDQIIHIVKHRTFKQKVRSIISRMVAIISKLF